MNRKIFTGLGLSAVMMANLIIPAYASDVITSEDFNGFNTGAFASQVARAEWAAATSGSAHTVEFISESEGDMAIQMTVGNGSSGVSVYRRGLAITKSMLVKEKKTDASAEAKA